MKLLSVLSLILKDRRLIEMKFQISISVVWLSKSLRLLASNLLPKHRIYESLIQIQLLIFILGYC